MDFRDFAWPQGVEFIYTNFLVVVKVNNQLYAQIEFGKEAHLIYIQFFKENQKTKRPIFDDRGFLSSILYYNEDGQEDYQDYLNLAGSWQIRENLKTQSVEVNPVERHRFVFTFQVGGQLRDLKAMG